MPQGKHLLVACAAGSAFRFVALAGSAWEARPIRSCATSKAPVDCRLSNVISRKQIQYALKEKQKLRWK